jgi:hypothetical protein
MKNCLDCPHHEIIPDPDPHDWFCDDDIAIICKLKASRPKESIYAADRASFKRITCACRPYMARKEANTPDWCPLKEKKVSKKK